MRGSALALVIVGLLLLWYVLGAGGASFSITQTAAALACLLIAGGVGYVYGQELAKLNTASEPATVRTMLGGSEGTPTFSYYMPPGVRSVVTAITVSRITPTQTIITPYYEMGKMLVTHAKVAKRLGYDPDKVVHSENPTHNEKLHTPTDPYKWHAHIEMPTQSVERLIVQLLKHYGPRPSEPHASRIIAAYMGKTAEAQEYPDGARLVLDVCDDKSGLEFMVDLRREWGDVPPLTKQEAEWVEAAASRIRPCTGAEVIDLLLKRFHPAALLRWDGFRGNLQHYLAKAGCVIGLEMLAGSRSFDVNARRPKDGYTILDMGKYYEDQGKTPEVREGGKRVVEFVERHNTIA